MIAAAAGGVGGRAPLDVPEAVARRRGVRHLLDGFGTALGGRAPGTVAAASTVAAGARRSARGHALRHHERIGAPAAAFATGALVHALDFDDTHAGGLVHATAVVAAGGVRGRRAGRRARARGARRGRRRLRDGLPGRGRRTARLPRPRPARHAWSAGVFSSALVAARLLGLDAATRGRRAGHRRQPGRWAARVPAHRRVDQAAPPGLRVARRESSPPGSPPPAPPDRRPCSTARTASTTRWPTGAVDRDLDRSTGSASAGRPPGSASSPTRPASSRTPRSTRSATRCARRGSAPPTCAEVVVDVHPTPRRSSATGRPRPGPARARRTPRSSPCRGASRRCSSTATSPSTPTTPESIVRPGGGRRSPRGCADGDRRRRPWPPTPPGAVGVSLADGRTVTGAVSPQRRRPGDPADRRAAATPSSSATPGARRGRPRDPSRRCGRRRPRHDCAPGRCSASCPSRTAPMTLTAIRPALVPLVPVRRVHVLPRPRRGRGGVDLRAHLRRVRRGGGQDDRRRHAWPNRPAPRTRRS